MAAGPRIAHGNPIWLSPSIIPSKDTVVSPMSSPTLAVVKVTSQDVFIYVKVDNISTVGFRPCSCTATGAWTNPTIFSGFLGNPLATSSASRFGTTFTASPSGDSLSGAVNFLFTSAASARRVWDWSPDGRFFAYVASPNGNDCL
jgi:hypothetical protein